MGTIPHAEKDRRAVEVVAGNGTGTWARRLIDTHPAFTPARLRALAGTAPDYQRHVLGRARAGDPRPFTPVAATSCTCCR